jgi:hypothetical protein
LREDREPGLVGGPEGAPAGRDREDDERQREETEQGERLPSRGRCRRRDQLNLARPVGDPISMLGVTVRTLTPPWAWPESPSIEALEARIAK